jgi:outer membrane protein
MRNVSVLILAFMMVCMWSLPAGSADVPSIAVVDLQRCLLESNEGKRMLEKLKTKKDEMQKRLDVRQEEVLKLNDELEKQGMMLSADVREKKMRELERLKREFKYFYDELNAEMRKADNEVKKMMLKDLEGVVKEIGEKGKYLFIFERRSSGIMFYETALDITSQVIEAYNIVKP